MARDKMNPMSKIIKLVECPDCGAVIINAKGGLLHHRRRYCRPALPASKALPGVNHGSVVPGVAGEAFPGVNHGSVVPGLAGEDDDVTLPVDDRELEIPFGDVKPGADSGVSGNEEPEEAFRASDRPDDQGGLVNTRSNDGSTWRLADKRCIGSRYPFLCNILCGQCIGPRPLHCNKLRGPLQKQMPPKRSRK
jgi:hypothetical protein